MTIFRGYKTELQLNNKQRTACLKACGVARFTYNWGLHIKIDEYQKTGKSPSFVELNRRLNVLKKTEFPWMYEVSKCVPQEALQDLERAFQHFFRRIKNGEKPGFPKFKSRKKRIGNFRVRGYILVNAHKVRLPKLGWVKLKQKNYLPIDQKILSTTVSEKAGRWFVSLQVEEEREIPVPPKASCGVDVGIHHLATLDDETVFENPKALLKLENKLKRQHKIVSRRKKGSRNRKKSVQHLQQLYYKIACVRKDAIHKATTEITKRYDMIGVESLNVNGMLKNHSLAKSIADASFFEFHRQLRYKSAWNGGQLVEVDQFFPSSKPCSQSGWIKRDLKIADRIFVCEQCGLVLDRDHNAAINLKECTVGSTGSDACEEER
jgi:putative transposase